MLPSMGACCSSRDPESNAREGIYEFLGLNPRDALAYNSRADAYLNLGEYHLAIQDYDEALAIFPQLGEAYAGRARSYQFLGRDLEVQQDVDRAVEFGFDRLLLEAEIEEERIQRL